MSCIHFKFKNRQDYEKVAISGLEVSGRELKEAILKKKKIGHSNLEIKDAQTKRVYSDTDMIKRNASVIVMRSVIQNAAKLPKTQHKDPSLLPPAGLDKETFSANLNDLQKASDLTSLSGSEEDKLLMMMRQAGEGYTAEDYAKLPLRSGIHPGLYKGPPPRGYVCNRCRKPGHWIQLCPTNGDPNFDKRNKQDLPKTSTVGMKSKHIMPAPKEKEIPEELKCPICKKLLRDAVVIPCCNRSFCDECIREHLLEQEFTCPLCEEADVSPDSLAPNKLLRESVKQFKNQAAEEKSIAVATFFSRSGASLTPHQVSASHISPKPPITSSTPSLLSKVTSSSKVKPSLSTTSTSTVVAALNMSTPPTVTKSPQKPAPTVPPPVKPIAPVVVASTTAAVKDIVKDDSQEATVTPPTAATTAPSSDPGKEDSEEVQPSGGGEDKPTLQPDSSAKLSVPDAVKGRSQSPSPQRSRSKSPIPKEAKHQSSILSHPLASKTHLPQPLPALHPPLPLITGLPPSILPLPLLHSQQGPMPGTTSLLNSLPGLGVIRTARAPVPQQAVLKDYQAEAEFLLGPKRPRPASPPLTADEFYRQQKFLNQFISRKSPVPPTESGSDFSSDSETDDTSDSYSSSASLSESGVSAYSDSRSHSTSVSPPKQKGRRHASSRKVENSHRHRKRAKESTKERERGRGKERGREREIEGGRERRIHKRRRREVCDETEDKHRSKRHRHKLTTSRDPSLDHFHQSSDNISSTASETARHQRHKKAGKRKHRHHRSVRMREEVRPERLYDEMTEDRDLAMVEELEPEGSNIRHEVGVVNNGAMLNAGGEFPEIRANVTESITGAEGVVEQVLVIPLTSVTEKQAKAPAGSRIETENRKEVDTWEVVVEEPSKIIEPASKEDKLLDDIDRLLAEEKTTEQVPEPLKPVVDDSGAKEHVVEERREGGEERREGGEERREGGEERREGGEERKEGREERREGEEERKEGEEGKEGGAVCEGAATSDENRMAVVGMGEEGDQLCLHAEENMIDDDTADLELDRNIPDANNELEEGELLSEVDTDKEDNSEVGQLQPTVPGQVQADPILDASVPNRPRVKPRLRSVASTVQVVNSSETPDLTPSDVESTESSLLLPPSPPPPEQSRSRTGKKRKQHREWDQDRPKKRKLKEKEKTAGHRHRQKKRMRDQERGREREREGEGEGEGEGERERERGWERKHKEKIEGKRREKHRHRHKKHILL